MQYSFECLVIQLMYTGYAKRKNHTTCYFFTYTFLLSIISLSSASEIL